MQLPDYKTNSRFFDTLALVAVIAMALLLSFRHIYDADLFYHIATGREILREGSIPLTNTLVWAESERTFYPNPAWLFGVMMALVERSFGLSGVVLVKTGAVLILLTTLYRLCRRNEAKPLLAAPLIFVVAMGSAFRFSDRPDLFSLLFFALCLLLLSDKGRLSGRIIWLLPPLFALWANIHAGFILGLILIAATLCGELFAGRWQRDKAAVKQLGLIFVLCLLATFIAPHPLTNLLFLTQLLEPRSYPITEYFAPRPGEQPWFYATVILVALWALWRRARPRDWAMLLSPLIFLFLAFYSVRFVPFFLFALLPWIIHSINDWRIQSHWPPFPLPPLGTGIAKLMLLVALPTAIFLWLPLPLGFGSGVEPSVAPLGSVRFLSEVHVTGRLYNSHSLGGVGAMYLAPHYKMYQTAYFQVEKDRIEEAYHAAKNPLDWKSFLDRYGIALVWLDTTREPHTLDYYPVEEWALLYYDDYSAVFARRSRENAAVIAAHEYRVANPPLLATISGNEFGQDSFAITTGANEARRVLSYNSDNHIARSLLAFFLARQPGEEAAALAVLDELEASSPTANIYFEKGRLYSRLGRHTVGEEALRRYVSLAPDDPEGYVELARLLLGAGQNEGARAVLNKLIQKLPDYGYGYLLLGRLQLNAEELDAAWRSLSQARELMGNNAEVHNLLGIVKAIQGDLPGALFFFNQALEIDPTYEEARRNQKRALAESGTQQ